MNSLKQTYLQSDENLCRFKFVFLSPKKRLCTQINRQNVELEEQLNMWEVSGGLRPYAGNLLKSVLAL